MSIKKQVLRLALAAMFITSSLVSYPVMAVEIDDFMSSNDAPWYDPNFYSDTSGCGGTNVSGTTNIHKMWNYFVDKGLSSEAAAGVLGNIQEESGFSATRQEDSQRFPRGGWGIVQWTADRRTAIASKIPSELKKYYAAQYGKATSEANGYIAEGIPEGDADKLMIFELDYLHDEAIVRQTRNHPVLSGYGLTGMSEWESLKKASSVRQASDLWLYSFERPADQSDNHAKKREGFGQDIYDRLVADSEGLGSGGSCMSGEVGDLQNLTREYAWPTYKRSGSPDATVPREAYKLAVDKARSQGRYVGGTLYPGIDCGGFVTLLVTNSGYDPNYNSEGRGGNTVHQEEWVKKNWTEVKPAGGKFDVANLQPGDVAFWPGHTYIFVGEGVFPNTSNNPDVFSGVQIASSSWDERAPMAGAEDLNHPNIRWYRKG